MPDKPAGDSLRAEQGISMTARPPRESELRPKAVGRSSKKRILIRLPRDQAGCCRSVAGFNLFSASGYSWTSGDGFASGTTSASCSLARLRAT